MRSVSFKNTIYFVVFILIAVACDSPSDISGRIEGAEKQELKIYLIEPKSLWDVAASYLGEVIDSAIVEPDGSFEFHNLPETKEPVLLEIALQQTGNIPSYLQTENPAESNYMPFLWQPGESLQITAEADNFQQSFSIDQASDQNKELLRLRDISTVAYRTYMSGKNWELENEDQLLEKEDAVLKYQTQLMNFADSTKYLIPALVALRWVSPSYVYERVPEFLVNQCNEWKNNKQDHPWVHQLCEKSNPENLPVLVGDLFPNHNFSLLSNDSMSLNDLLGDKLTIIDLWASWCAPCRKENREILAPVWNEYHNKGLQIIAYGLESDKSIWRAAAEADGANRWVQASDLQGDDAPFMKKIRIQTIPSNFILDDKGVVIAKNVHGKALLEFVKNYMNK